MLTYTCLSNLLSVREKSSVDEESETLVSFSVFLTMTIYLIYSQYAYSDYA